MLPCPGLGGFQWVPWSSLPEVLHVLVAALARRGVAVALMVHRHVCLLPGMQVLLVLVVLLVVVLVVVVMLRVVLPPLLRVQVLLILLLLLLRVVLVPVLRCSPIAPASTTPSPSFSMVLLLARIPALLDGFGDFWLSGSLHGAPSPSV